MKTITADKALARYAVLTAEPGEWIDVWDTLYRLNTIDRENGCVYGFTSYGSVGINTALTVLEGEGYAEVSRNPHKYRLTSSGQEFGSKIKFESAIEKKLSGG